MAGRELSAISALLDKLEPGCINQAPWGITGHQPEASFSMAYGSEGIYLKYTVSEEHLQARYKNINDPVYKDSCVEFFISFDDSGAYYNLEFNHLGVAMGGYGPGKDGRAIIPAAYLQKIKIFALAEPKDPETGLHHWAITLLLPFDIFIYNKLTGLKGLTCRANFYKCGDELPQPHFLSWVPMTHPEPEFHLPQFFGTLVFA